MQILGISGSLRRGSYNRTLLRAARTELPSGVRLIEWDALAELPAFDEDLERTAPRSVLALRRSVAGADALLIATPEYNASIPGTLKNALDWVSRPYPDNVLRQKPSLVIGASTGPFGAVWAQAQARKALTASGALVVDNEFGVARADTAFSADGSLANAGLKMRLRLLLGDLILEVARQRTGQGDSDGSGIAGTTISATC
jgi:chromate reductase, NAD(P)H dehydrogenase (quinone)